MKLAVVGFAAIASVALAAPAHAQSKGESVYKSTCSTCHEAGVAGAPKLGDKAAWAPKLKLGMPELYKIALNGKPGTAMVAKGGNASLSEADVKAAVDFMVSKAK